MESRSTQLKYYLNRRRLHLASLGRTKCSSSQTRHRGSGTEHPQQGTDPAPDTSASLELGVPSCLQAAPSSTLGQRSSRALVKQLHVNDISLPALLSSAQWLGEAAWPRFHTQVLLLAICTCRRVIAHEYGSRSYRSDPVWVQMDPEGPA